MHFVPRVCGLHAHNSVTSSSTMSVTSKSAFLHEISRLNGQIRTDVVIEAHESTAEFFVALHDDPDSRAHAFVDQL